MARILIINDEEDLLELCKLCLESAGHVVDVAAEPSRGLALASANRPDVVLLDLLMPEMSGEELFRRMRAEPRTATIPVIVMSGLDDAGARAERMGATGLLAKPFDEDGLLEAVHRALAPG